MLDFQQPCSKTEVVKVGHHRRARSGCDHMEDSKPPRIATWTTMRKLNDLTNIQER